VSIRAGTKDTLHSFESAGSFMFCPLNPSHELVEIAEGVFQCPFCGYGPNTEGSYGYWALSYVERGEGIISALCVRFRPELDCYAMSSLLWGIDIREKKSPGTLVETYIGLLSTAEELAESPLPVLVTGAKKWSMPPGKPRLKSLGFSSLGPKETALRS